MKKWLPRILILLWPLALFAGEPVFRDDGGLCQFVLQDYPLSRVNEDKVDVIVADLLRRHEAVFNFTARADFHIRIRIFGRFDDYRQYVLTNYSGFESEHMNEAVSNLAGYYSLRDREVVTWRQRDPTYLANNILHECSHAIMHRQFRVLPVWLDEGCAVYFSFPLYMRSESAEKRLDYQWFELKKWLEAGSLPNLRDFLNWSPPEFRAQDPARTYPISWSLFQLLMSTPQNRAAMNEMIREYQNPFTANCAESLDEAYPGGLAQMEKDWRAWIARGAANVLGPR